MHIRLITPSDADWSVATDLISHVFWETYHAHICNFPQELMIAKNGQNKLTAAVGLRTKDTGFFSSTYISGDLGQTMSAKLGEPVAQDQIIEAVSMASVTPCAALPVMNAVIAEGRKRNMRWGLFTGTRNLRGLLLRAGLPYKKICAARPTSVTDPENWGEYYTTDPWVCAFTESKRQPIALRPTCQTARLRGVS
ncbi:MAG: thermostable hemolysin [Pseudoruegeria sp.]